MKDLQDKLDLYTTMAPVTMAPVTMAPVNPTFYTMDRAKRGCENWKTITTRFIKNKSLEQCADLCKESEAFCVEFYHSDGYEPTCLLAATGCGDKWHTAYTRYSMDGRNHGRGSVSKAPVTASDSTAPVMAPTTIFMLHAEKKGCPEWDTLNKAKKLRWVTKTTKERCGTACMSETWCVEFYFKVAAKNNCMLAGENCGDKYNWQYSRYVMRGRSHGRVPYTNAPVTVSQACIDVPIKDRDEPAGGYPKTITCSDSTKIAGIMVCTDTDSTNPGVVQVRRWCKNSCGLCGEPQDPCTIKFGSDGPEDTCDKCNQSGSGWDGSVVTWTDVSAGTCVDVLGKCLEAAFDCRMKPATVTQAPVTAPAADILCVPEGPLSIPSCKMLEQKSCMGSDYSRTEMTDLGLTSTTDLCLMDCMKETIGSVNRNIWLTSDNACCEAQRSGIEYQCYLFVEGIGLKGPAHLVDVAVGTYAALHISKPPPASSAPVTTAPVTSAPVTSAPSPTPQYLLMGSFGCKNYDKVKVKWEYGSGASGASVADCYDGCEKWGKCVDFFHRIENGKGQCMFTTGDCVDKPHWKWKKYTMKRSIK